MYRIFLYFLLLTVALIQANALQEQQNSKCNTLEYLTHISKESCDKEESISAKKFGGDFRPEGSVRAQSRPRTTSKPGISDKLRVIPPIRRPGKRDEAPSLALTLALYSNLPMVILYYVLWIVFFLRIFLW